MFLSELTLSWNASYDCRLFEAAGDDSTGAGLLHRFEMMSLVVLIFCVWCGVYFTLDSEACSTQAGWCTFLALLVVGSNVVLLAALTGRFCAAWCARNHVKERLTGCGRKLGRLFSSSSGSSSSSTSSSSRSSAGGHQSAALGRGAGGHSNSTSTVDLDMSCAGIELRVNPFSREGRENDEEGEGAIRP